MKNIKSIVYCLMVFGFRDTQFVAQYISTANRDLFGPALSKSPIIYLFLDKLVHFPSHSASLNSRFFATLSLSRISLMVLDSDSIWSIFIASFFRVTSIKLWRYLIEISAKRWELEQLHCTEVLYTWRHF